MERAEHMIAPSYGANQKGFLVLLYCYQLPYHTLHDLSTCLIFILGPMPVSATA